MFAQANTVTHKEISSLGTVQASAADTQLPSELQSTGRPASLL